MKVGIWQGSTPERVHAKRDDQDSPCCGTRSISGQKFAPNNGVFWRHWDGDLHQVDCKRCLVVLRTSTRRTLALLDRRIAGQDGIQRDAFEVKK